MRVGSLFSGIGGLELGLERAGMKTVWQVECDEYARKVLEKHWPDVERFDDVRKVHGPGGECRRAEHYGWECSDYCLDPVDLICGGFPCQDISVAGKGAGLAGERSGLWSEFRRLIGELRPRYVLVENVAALLVRGLGDILGDLASLGYDAEWDCLPASAFGAPHQRDRLFVVAYASGQSGDLSAGARKNVPSASGLGSSWPAPKSRPWEFESQFCGAANGVPSRVDRLRCLGNAVVPQVAEFIGRRIMEAA